MESISAKDVSPYCRALARQFSDGQVSWESLVPLIRRQSSDGQQDLVNVVEGLLAEAQVLLGPDPRYSWALTLVARETAQALENALLEAECTLSLARGLNALGEFDMVPALCDQTAETFSNGGQPRKAAACHLQRALAYSYLGKYDTSLEALEAAKSLWGGAASGHELALCDWIEGKIRQGQNRYQKALALLKRAKESLAQEGMVIAAARCDRDMAVAYLLSEPEKSLASLNQAREIFVMAGYPLETALCDHYIALVHDERNCYEEALAVRAQAREAFATHGAGFFAALSDVSLGIVYWRLNRYEEALEVCQRARDYYAEKGIVAKVAICDVNMANVFYSLNRYGDALTLYQRAADLCLQQNLPVDVARCQVNMALIHEKKGQYGKALALYQRARNTFTQQGLSTYTALCEENMAAIYQQMGQHDKALELYQCARDAFSRQGLAIYTARCDTHMADTHVAIGQYQHAQRCLKRARTVCAEAKMPVHVAACDQLLAHIHSQLGEAEKAISLFQQSAAVFAERELPVDVALCDLGIGETNRTAGNYLKARSHFRQALTILAPHFPDQAWRAEYGLYHCARAEADLPAAMEHCLQAARYINQAHEHFRVERFGERFFADRRHVYDEAISLALNLNEPEKALEVVELGKARSFVSQLDSRGLRLRARDVSDAYLSDLLRREEALASRLASLRKSLYVHTDEGAGEALRSLGELGSDQPEALTLLEQLSSEYEEVVDRLRLTAPCWVTTRAASPFELSKFRELVSSCITSSKWGCLEYYMSGTDLVILYVDPQNVVCRSKELTDFDRLVLRQCTSPEPDLRNLVYRGIIHGHAAPRPPGQLYLRHVSNLLIPEEIKPLADSGFLIIAPHNFLHRLPFHALLIDDRHLIEKVSILYTPTLHALQRLLVQPANTNSATADLGRALWCGLSDFDGRAPRLRHTKTEIQGLYQLCGKHGELLWGERATVAEINRQNVTGILASYDVLHFATHAYLDPLSPFQSRVVLHGSDLTAVDILDLSLKARLVTLSVCQSATGEIGPGDEMVSLARAFFLAGADAVVASLWVVDDESGAFLMREFYERLKAGNSIVGAMRDVQREMIAQGYTPFHWASFVVMGRP